MLVEPFDFYVLNHDGIKVFVDIERDGKYVRTHVDPMFREFLESVGLIIVDEGAVFRNSQTDLWRALQAIVGDRRLWWMTGSPMPNAPTDIWAQARLVCPHLVPRFFGRFRDMVMTKVTQFKWVPRPGWEQTVYSMVRPVVRFRREEFLDIKAPMYEPRKVELSAEQRKIEQELLREFYVELRDGRLTVANEGVRRGKLLQLYGGALYLDGGSRRLLDTAPRFQELLNILEQSGGKAIVFAPYDHHVELIAGALKGRGIEIGVVTGGVGATARNLIFKEFQDGTLPVLLANPATMAHGLTLTASHVIVWWAPIDDFEVYEQANGRITRPGQTQQPVIFHLQSSRLEAETYRRLQRKESMQGLLMSLLEQLNPTNRVIQ